MASSPSATRRLTDFAGVSNAGHFASALPPVKPQPCIAATATLARIRTWCSDSGSGDAERRSCSRLFCAVRALAQGLSSVAILPRVPVISDPMHRPLRYHEAFSRAECNAPIMKLNLKLAFEAEKVLIIIGRARATDVRLVRRSAARLSPLFCIVSR